MTAAFCILLYLVSIKILVHLECYRLRPIHHGASGPLRKLALKTRSIVKESMPLTFNQVEELERESVGIEAEETTTPKCPLMEHHLSKRVVKAIVENDMKLLCDRSLDASGRPAHLQQKWKMKPNRKRLSPVLFRIGEKLKGRVTLAFPTYALIDIGSTSYGVLHARDMSEGWIDRVDHSISSGDDIVVTVKSIDEDGRFIRLTLLDLPKFESPTGEALQRRPIHSFKVEEVVSGVIRRRSPLGYYIDVGATVDGFLHVNDRKLPRKYTGVARQPFRIGTHIVTLYVKGVDLIKNRIQLSENSIGEEMEKRCITGQETPEQQSVYTSAGRRSMLQKMQLADLEAMRMIGGYDQLLDDVGGERKATPEYVMYLQNRKLRSELLKKRDSLHDDADNMTDAELRKATKEYNLLSMQIAELDGEALEPPPFERTVYKYGEPGVWESRVYTPLDEKNPTKYFEKVSDEVVSALRDVQGENFNFQGSMREDLFNAERRSEFVEMLWSRFHQAPSKLSQIEDTEPREPLLEDVEDLMPGSLLSEVGDSPLSDPPDADTVIATLESYNDPDANELVKMIRGATDFNPFAHSNKLVDDEKSALAGACAMVNDDVTQWQERLDKIYEDAGVDPTQVVLNTLSGKSANYARDASEGPDMSTSATDGSSLGDSIPNLNEAVDSTPGAQSEDNFVMPTVDEDPDEEYIGDSKIETSYDIGSPSEAANDEEHADSDDDYKCIANEIFGAEDHLTSVKPSVKNTIEPESHNEELIIPEDDSCSAELAAALPKGPLEPTEDLYVPSTLSEDISNILDEVKQLTGGGSPNKDPVDTVPPSRTFENCDTKKVRYQMYLKQQRYMDRVTRLYTMSKIPARPLPTEQEAPREGGSILHEGEHTSPIAPCDIKATLNNAADGLGSFDFSDEPEENQNAEEISREPPDPQQLKAARSLMKSIGNSDQSRKTLARMAKKNLPPEVIAKYQFDEGEPEYMEELATILQQGKQRPKIKPYTYYPEGIEKALQAEDRRSVNRKVRDANLKLAKLKRNKRFLHMLDRLGVDPDELSFENIHLLLPQELASQRPPPYRRLMGIGESNLPVNQG